VLLIFLSFFVFGAVAPFILTLGYIWVDTFRPQDVAWFVMNQLPVAQLTGFAAVAGYVLLDRRSPPRFTFTTLLTLLLAGWITMTMLWAEVPSAGWSKWDWAFKSVLFSAFIPWAIRSRVQIEAFVQVYVLALAANFIPFAAKVLISGGGYGHNLGLQTGNANLAEGELLSAVVLMAIPLALYLARHTQLLPRTRLLRFGYTAPAANAAAGTRARAESRQAAAAHPQRRLDGRQGHPSSPCHGLVGRVQPAIRAKACPRRAAPRLWSAAEAAWLRCSTARKRTRRPSPKTEGLCPAIPLSCAVIMLWEDRPNFLRSGLMLATVTSPPPTARHAGSARADHGERTREMLRGTVHHPG
jgi:hypothetical protein